MATSTEATVRATIVTAIEGVYDTLGFDQAPGNVKDYLLEYEPEERQPAYLMASVDGKKVIRAWAVDVRGNDDWYAAGNITKRTYRIRIRAYYAPGVGGEGINALIDGARAVRNAIRLLGSRLSETVDRVVSTGEIESDVVEGSDALPGRMIVGSMEYVAEKRNPDF